MQHIMFPIPVNLHSILEYPQLIPLPEHWNEKQVLVTHL